MLPVSPVAQPNLPLSGAGATGSLSVQGYRHTEPGCPWWTASPAHGAGVSGSCNRRAHSYRNSLGFPLPPASVRQVSSDASGEESVLVVLTLGEWGWPWLFAVQRQQGSFSFSAVLRAVTGDGDMGALHHCSLL